MKRIGWANNVSTISKQLILRTTIVILALALLLVCFDTIGHALRSKKLQKQIETTELEILRQKNNLSTAQDDISKHQSEINRLENEQ
jgi:septal ring factor EnvC (AmiA/AmiB activator)